MKKLLVLVLACTVSACGFFMKEGPMFPDNDVEEIARYDDQEFVENGNRKKLFSEPCKSGKCAKQEPAHVEYVYVDEPRYAENISYVEPRVYKEQSVAVEELGFSPEVYTILATRSTNKLIDETTDIHENRKTPSIYVMKTRKANDELPNGTFYADRTTKNILSGSRTYNVVNNINDADYHIESVVDVFDYEGFPVIQYKTVMADKNENIVKEWIETIQQVRNDDRSWW